MNFFSKVLITIVILLGCVQINANNIEEATPSDIFLAANNALAAGNTEAYEVLMSVFWERTNKAIEARRLLEAMNGQHSINNAHKPHDNLLLEYAKEQSLINRIKRELGK